MESIEELSKMTLQEIKKSYAYSNCTVSKPGFPKSKMVKADLLDLLNLDKKFLKKRQEATPLINKPESDIIMRSEPRLTKRQQQVIVKRLEEIASGYLLLGDARQFTFTNAANGIKERETLSLLECQNIKGIGPAVFKEIILALQDEPSDRLTNLLNGSKFKELKKHYEKATKMRY